MAESYFQHAEHYFRILNAIAQATQQPPQQQAGGAPRRQQINDGFSNEDGNESNGNSDGEDADQQAAGMGDQPGGAESRDIPIVAAPPAN